MYREIQAKLKTILNQKNAPALLILGMRQVGKSTLALSLVEKDSFVKFNFDLPSDRLEFTKIDRHELALFADKYKGKVIIIDEIQKEPLATSIIKYLYDNFQFKFILTGSSEIKIRKEIGDSLVGRIHEEKLYPLSLKEICIQKGLLWNDKNEFSNYDENQKNILKMLVFGSLPNLLNIDTSQHEIYINDYTNTILSKDVLEIAGTRKSSQVYLLAKLLALQIGQLVNFNELALNTEMSRQSVYRYIDIFEQMGIIVRAKPISTNEREAIAKATKIYFTDLGVRNSLIGNFEAFSKRLDKGQLLENLVFVGIKRKLSYLGDRSSLGFFRSIHGSEVDIVRKLGSIEKLYEIKVNNKSNIKKNMEIITFDTAQKFVY